MAEFEDVLTNQPVVIDNVSARMIVLLDAYLPALHVIRSLGLRNDKGGLCWTRPSEMFLSVLVRLYG